MTAAQRRAVSGILTGILAVGVTPTASSDATTRSVAGWGYAFAGGPAAYTLPTDAGSYSVTGSAAATTVGHVLTAAPGAYTVTGSDATLRTGHVLGAETGAYTVTGTAASLLRARVASTEAGAYTLTGSAASLLVGHVLLTEGGAYLLTGSDADLLRGRGLVTEAGAYLLTGADATLVRGPAPMGTEPGAYVLTGSEAGLLVGRVLLTDAGAYLLTGTDAALVVTTPGAMTLPTDVGLYVLTGAAADLLYSGAVVPPAYVVRELVTRRLRRSPVISDESRWVFHHAIQIDLETGVGLVTGEGSDPQLLLRWSDDGGHTWSNEHAMSAGRMGEYQTRAVWLRLGRARHRVYETTVTSPTAWHLLRAFLDLEQGDSLMAVTQIPTPVHPFVDAAGPHYGAVVPVPAGRCTRARVRAGFAPGDGTYILTAPDADLPNARVATDSDTVTVDLTVPGVIRWHAIGGAGSWVPLSLGVEPLTFVSDGAGQPIFVWYAP